MKELVFKTEDNQLRTCSVTIAQMFGIKHRHLKGIIRDVMDTLENPEDNYFEGYLIDRSGKKIPAYIMDRNGFELLAMLIPGKRALCSKMDFITAFNMMAEKIAIEKQMEYVEIFQNITNFFKISGEHIANLEHRVNAIEKKRN